MGDLWVAAHIGIKGSEAIDRATQNATFSKISLNIHPPISNFGWLLRRLIFKNWSLFCKNQKYTIINWLVSPSPPPFFRFEDRNWALSFVLRYVLDCMTLRSFVLLFIFWIGLEGGMVTCQTPFFIRGSGAGLFVFTTLVLDWTILIPFVPSLPFEISLRGQWHAPFWDWGVENRLVRLYYISTRLYHPYFVCTVFTLRDWPGRPVTYHPYRYLSFHLSVENKLFRLYCVSTWLYHPRPLNFIWTIAVCYLVSGPRTPRHFQETHRSFYDFAPRSTYPTIRHANS